MFARKEQGIARVRERKKRLIMGKELAVRWNHSLRPGCFQQQQHKDVDAAAAAAAAAAVAPAAHQQQLLLNL